MDTTVQAQPQPQPEERVAGPMSSLPPSIPTVQNTTQYLAIGPQGQLYAYDLNLGSWGMATGKQMEQMMIVSGIPPQTLQAIKRMLPSL